MKLQRFLWSGLLGFSFLFSACSQEAAFKQHFSTEGLIPEAYLPSDVGLVVSYSSRDSDQYAAIQAIEQALNDQGRVAETVSESLDTQLGEVGLDFERDLEPAFGDQFRMVYALAPGGEEAEMFTVVTLENPDQMESVLSTLVSAEQMTLKQLSTFDAYVDEDSNIYLSLHKDLLFMTNRPENLVAMLEQEKGESLWASDGYQETLKNVGGDFMFYAALYPSFYTEELPLSGFSISDIPSVVKQQLLVARAEEKGFRFDVWVDLDQKAAKEAGISFDVIPRSEPYLFKEVPEEDLLAYFESYGLQQTFEQADALGDDSSAVGDLRTLVRSYFGMDFDEEILSFLDKGYALALHQVSEGVVPGLTIYVDISSDLESAQEFMSKLDGQLSGFLTVLAAVLPEGVTKDTVTWGKDTFNRLTLDLSSIPRSSESPLPTVVTSSVIQLFYGISDERLILSTASPWDTSAESVAESEWFESLNQKLEDVNEGLILLNPQGISEFVGALRALREQLGLQVSEEALNFEDFLEGFFGGIAMSETKAYGSHFSGFLMLAD